MLYVFRQGHILIRVPMTAISTRCALPAATRALHPAILRHPEPTMLLFPEESIATSAPEHRCCRESKSAGLGSIFR